MPTTIAELVAAAKLTIENLSPAQAAAERAAGGALLVDIREADELAANGAFPDAVHAPRGMLEFYADPASAYHREQFDPGRRVILCCASGGRSALAVKALHELGYADVAHVDGGMKAWKDAGLPTAAC
jgi:rhodanese-related sulfurtransferase